MARFFAENAWLVKAVVFFVVGYVSYKWAHYDGYQKGYLAGSKDSDDNDEYEEGYADGLAAGAEGALELMFSLFATRPAKPAAPEAAATKDDDDEVVILEAVDEGDESITLVDSGEFQPRDAAT